MAVRDAIGFMRVASKDIEEKRRIENEPFF